MTAIHLPGSKRGWDVSATEVRVPLMPLSTKMRPPLNPWRHGKRGRAGLETGRGQRPHWVAALRRGGVL